MSDVRKQEDAALAELRELSDDASPGPWQAYFTTHGDPYVRRADMGLLLGAAVTSWENDRTDVHTKVSSGPEDYGKANAQFIAAAVNYVRSRLAAPSAGEDADPFAALRALPEYQSYVSAVVSLAAALHLGHRPDAHQDEEAHAAAAFGRAVVVHLRAHPGAPSTDPAPEPGDAT